MHIDRVLVPVDFSPPSTLAVNHGVALARKLKAQLSLLHVVESGSALVYTFPSEADRVVTQRKEQAEKMCARCPNSFVKNPRNSLTSRARQTWKLQMLQSPA